MYFKFIISTTLVLLYSCSAPTPTTDAMSYQFRYTLDQPLKTFKLPKKLKEISGISFDKSGLLNCIQDEDGIIFQYDLQEKEVVKKITFGQVGDYEDIAIVGKDAYVLRSDGVLLEVQNFGQANQYRTQHTTRLSAKNDTEGLVYDKQRQRLLIACKGKAGSSSESYKNQKAIYSFDLKTKTLTDKPVYLLNNEQLLKYLAQHPIKGFKPKAHQKFPLQPSGIAIHPTTKNIYILASVGNMLIVLSPVGNILHLEVLDNDFFPKPEGITFDKNADLYIASERAEEKGERGKIWRFRPL